MEANGQELCRFKSCAISSWPVLPMYVNMYGYWWMYAYVCMFFGGGGSSGVVVAGCDL